MIKKLFTLGLAIAAFAGNAQQFKTAKTLGKDVSTKTWAGKIHQVTSVNSVTIDTLTPSTIAAGGCGITGGLVNYLSYSTQDSGYSFGTAIPETFTYNIGTVVTITATTTELAQKYNVGSSAATITNVLVLPGAGSGTVTTTKANIYAGTTNQLTATSTPLGTSATKAMSAYSSAITATTVAQGYVSYSFATPVAVAANANFFTSVTVPAFGGTDKDTMAVLTTTGGCSSNSTDSLSWLQTTYVIPTAGTQVQWTPVKRLFGSANNLDLMIFPVIDITSTAGINNYVSHAGLSIYPASPNPANTNININFSVEKPSAVEIQVYDITGKIVKTVKNNDLVVGKNAISIDVTNLEAGSYMYCINANGNRMFSKFIVAK
jgi:hypothetical protein